jgi:hypothetical protein
LRVWAQSSSLFNVEQLYTGGGLVPGEHQQRGGAQWPGRRRTRAGGCDGGPSAVQGPFARTIVIVSLREAHDTSSPFEFHLFDDDDDNDGIVLFDGWQSTSFSVIHVVRGRRKAEP